MNQFISLLILSVCVTAAFAADIATEDVFERNKQRVVQIRVLESSGVRAAIGSGFAVGDQGEIITNFHVISELVSKPGQYRVEAIYNDGREAPLTLVDFDVINDLALVRSTLLQDDYFRVRAEPLGKGRRVFTMGTPLDIGLTIVEGTYNGLIEDSLYEKIHYTGSINPGMSGGPALLADGQVVGVNVATAGNQVSFLVPGRAVRDLIDRARAPHRNDPGPTLAKLRDQLLANQDVYMKRLIEAPLDTKVISDYRLPGRIAPFIKCWGDASREKKNLYESVTHQCSTEDDIYVSRSQSTGIISYKHDFVTTDALDSVRFYRLYQQFFQGYYDYVRADEEDVSNFECRDAFVDSNAITFKAMLCSRAYRKLPGLYDVVMRAATLNDDTHGVLTTLVLAGVSFENATRFAQKYLASVAPEPGAWTK